MIRFLLQNATKENAESIARALCSITLVEPSDSKSDKSDKSEKKANSSVFILGMYACQCQLLRLF